jgi:hypothetical protein
MATITTKYSVGDVVYSAGITTERKQHPCPDCLGERKWKAVSPAGSEYEFTCPRCSTGYHGHSDLSLGYSAHVPNVRRLTIGSVQFNSAPGSWDHGARYMAHETGVGSGTVHREADLFATEAEAIAASEVKAKLADREQEWCAKLYDKTLEISDYQLEHAMMKNAKDFRSEIGSLFWNISDLFDTIGEASDKDAILEAIDDYKRFTWERDKARFTAKGIASTTTPATDASPSASLAAASVEASSSALTTDGADLGEGE